MISIVLLEPEKKAKPQSTKAIGSKGFTQGMQGQHTNGKTYPSSLSINLPQKNPSSTPGTHLQLGGLRHIWVKRFAQNHSITSPMHILSLLFRSW